MADHDCPHMDACPMYQLLTLSGTLKAWQTRYCKADFRECARYRLSVEGKPVPDTLMPSGALLRQAGRGGGFG